jgi:hypothetical protein
MTEVTTIVATINCHAITNSTKFTFSVILNYLCTSKHKSVTAWQWQVRYYSGRVLLFTARIFLLDRHNSNGHHTQLKFCCTSKEQSRRQVRNCGIWRNWRVPCAGIQRRVTEVSKKRCASIFRVWSWRWAGYAEWFPSRAESSSVNNNNYYYYLQLSFHAVAVVVTPVQTKQE